MTGTEMTCNNESVSFFLCNAQTSDTRRSSFVSSITKSVTNVFVTTAVTWPVTAGPLTALWSWWMSVGSINLSWLITCYMYHSLHVYTHWQEVWNTFSFIMIQSAVLEQEVRGHIWHVLNLSMIPSICCCEANKALRWPNSAPPHWFTSYSLVYHLLTGLARMS